jgi:hypothetical protein
MITVDYENLCVTGEWSSKFKSKDEMFKAVRNYVVGEGKSIPHRSGKKTNQNRTGILDNRPYIFKGQTK